MKSIFSAFRSQQLSKGKFGSYGLYALGEIVLIVLGILVALGIDNWNNERKEKAAKKGLTVNQVVTIASIIDEETNAKAEKPTIASVYLNRINKGMPLQADPTVKFALNDFSIKRVLFKHLQVVSPYNTYKNRGLPPGPICTPQEATIDDVLNAPETDYLYFVASPAFDGTHKFSSTYTEHQKLATEYQKALDERFKVTKN